MRAELGKDGEDVKRDRLAAEKLVDAHQNSTSIRAFESKHSCEIVRLTSTLCFLTSSASVTVTHELCLLSDR